MSGCIPGIELLASYIFSPMTRRFSKALKWVVGLSHLRRTFLSVQGVAERPFHWHYPSAKEGWKSGRTRGWTGPVPPRWDSPLLPSRSILLGLTCPRCAFIRCKTESMTHYEHSDHESDEIPELHGAVQPRRFRMQIKPRDN